MRSSTHFAGLLWTLRAAVRQRAALPTPAIQGYRFGQRFKPPEAATRTAARSVQNPLEAYFDAHESGPGIWKWRHYFPIYHRHLAKFVGRDVRVLEIGIYSGGSIGMWQHYFGVGCTFYGVDIEPACKVYDRNSVNVFIGDQADPDFWQRFRREVAPIDVVIDDGGHLAHQQVATLQGLIPHLRRGGVYICEDIHGEDQRFHSYLAGLTRNLHATGKSVTGFQKWVSSVHVYPYLAVIERTEVPPLEFVAPRHGSEWQPFYEPTVRVAEGRRTH